MCALSFFFVRIAFQQRHAESLRLFEGDVRRQGRHVWICDDLEHDGAIGGERAIPRNGEIFGALDPQTAETDHLGIVRIREAR